MKKNLMFCTLLVSTMMCASTASFAGDVAREQQGGWFDRAVNSTRTVLDLARQEVLKQGTRVSFGTAFKAAYDVGRQGLSHAKAFASEQYHHAGVCAQAAQVRASALANGARQWAGQAYQGAEVYAQQANTRAAKLADGAYQWAKQASEGARTYAQQVTQQGLEHGRAMGTHALHWITATDVSDDNNRQATMMLRAGGVALGTVALSYLTYKAYQALTAPKAVVRPKSVAKQKHEQDKQRAQQLAQDALNAFLEKQKRQRRA